MEYKRVKPISYDKGPRKYNPGGALVFPIIEGLGLLGIGAAGAASMDYTGPSDQEIIDRIVSGARKLGDFLGSGLIPGSARMTPEQNREEVNPTSTTTVNRRYIPPIKRTPEFPSDIRTHTRPIPVSYEAVAKGDSIDVPGGRSEVEDIDTDGRMILGPPVSTSQNSQDKKPEDDKEKDKKKNGVKESIKQESKKIAKNIGKTYGRAAKGLAYGTAYGAPLLGLGLWTHNSFFKPEETVADSTLNAQDKQIIELNKINQIKQNQQKIDSIMRAMNTTPIASEISFLNRDTVAARAARSRAERYKRQGL